MYGSKIYRIKNFPIDWEKKQKVVDWLREADEKLHCFGGAHKHQIIRTKPLMVSRSDINTPTHPLDEIVFEYAETVCAGYYLAQRISRTQNVDTFQWKTICKEWGISTEILGWVVYMNDNMKMTFAQIAKAIDDEVLTRI